MNEQDLNKDYNKSIVKQQTTISDLIYSKDLTGEQLNRIEKFISGILRFNLSNKESLQ